MRGMTIKMFTSINTDFKHHSSFQKISILQDRQLQIN